MVDQDALIEANVRGYRRVARRYEEIHDEIFNEVEQTRVRAALAGAIEAIDPVPEGRRPRALDFGCGSGNVTRHLLDLGAAVVAADVSPRFLTMIERRFPGAPLETMALNGRDLEGLSSESVDLVVSYSVLHHIPDYLRAVRELCRVLRPGGVLLIDHEASPREWSGDPELAAYREAVLEHERARPRSPRRFLDPSHYRALARHYRIALRRRRDPRYWPEGDIHVWPDDHIEWDRVEQDVRAAGCEVVTVEDYLLYRRGAPMELYDRYRERAADVRLMLARRRR